MKKVYIIVLVLILVFSLAACSGGDNSSSGDSASSGGSTSEENDNGNGDSNDNDGNNGGGNAVPDGLNYIEENTFKLVWPSSGVATDVPKFEGVTLDEPYGVDDFAKIMAYNVPRSQFEAYMSKLEADGFVHTGDNTAGEADGLFISIFEKDSIEVRLDFDEEWSNLMITITLRN